MALSWLAEAGPYGGAAAVAVSFVCTVVAIILSAWHITMHLRNYTEPTYQRYIVRIIFMVPVYATMSFGALAYGEYAMYFNTIRDVYEAWVIYNFLSLCLAWVGGPGAVVTSLSGRLLKPSCLLMTCFLPPIPLDGRFIRRCKQGCLQFVFLKPILAATCLILYSRGLYSDGNFSLEDSYIYITCVYMASYTIAIYALILFYVACKDLLHSFNPIPKFLMIKAVVFLTYWQGVLLFTVCEVGWVKGGAEDAADLQNVLICVEMALGAMGFLYAFPYKQFVHSNMGAHATAIGPHGSAEHTGLTDSIKHAIDLNDVVSDTVHQFAPTYHDYVLYSDGSQSGAAHYGREAGLANSNGGSEKNLRIAELSSGIGLMTSEASEAEDAMTSRSSSLLSDPSAAAPGPPGAHAAEPDATTELVARTTTGDSRTTQVSVGSSSIVVRLPPPPEDVRSRANSLGFEGGQGGAPMPRASSDMTGISSQRSSATDGSAVETSVLRKGPQGSPESAKGHLDLLIDEDDLTSNDPSKSDLEGFIQR